ncbi:MAG: hypothetical protein GXY83_04215, partial [Rhodopirellula sp.]|nr:hypothetical protein [Rhodopirellula sp.]
ANLNSGASADLLSGSRSEVSLSGVNAVESFARYAKNFDEIHALAGAGEDTAVFTDATAEADYAAPGGVDLNKLPQILWLEKFEKIELWNSSTGSKTDEIDNIDQVFAWWE